MPWKLDGETLVVQDGKPVYVYPETAGKDFAGKEVPFDADLATNKISALNLENKDWRTKHGDLSTKYAAWSSLTLDDKPVDPEEARTAIQTVRNLKDGKLVEADRVQAVRDEEKRKYDTELAKRDQEITTLKATVDSKDIAHAFALSTFVKKELDLPPDGAIDIFGRYAKKDDKGNLVFEYKGEVIRSKKNFAEPAEIDEALEFIVDNHPNRDRYRRSDGASGSGADPLGGRTSAGGAKTKRRGEFDAMSGAERAKWMNDGGKVTD
jgi:hypothetical protein